MKKFNIPKIKLPKLDKKTQNKLINDAKITAKTLLGLCVLSAAIKGCNSGCHAMDQRKKAQEDADKKTFATLIDKEIVRNTGLATYYLDLDGDLGTTEAIAESGWSTRATAQFHDMTNGTVKSVAEWKKIAGRSQYFEYVKHQDTK